MYFLSDTPSAVREVQKFLYVISDKVNTAVPRIAIDGIYGAETESAVRVFQEIYRHNVSGKVDRETFESLYSLYSAAVIDIELSDYLLTDQGFPITLGTQNNDVAVIHLLINELGKTYTDIGYVNVRSTYFSDESQAAVIELQKIFNQPTTGVVDKHLFLRMRDELSALQRLKVVYV